MLALTRSPKAHQEDLAELELVTNLRMKHCHSLSPHLISCSGGFNSLVLLIETILISHDT